MTATFEGDLYSDAALCNSYDLYRSLRELGSAVWMPQREMWAVARYDEVRQALRADTVLISSKGVAANARANARVRAITLTSDGDTHMRRRQVLIQPVTPGPLKALRARLEAEAEAMVDGLADGAEFDAMPTFASHLPVTVVADLVGLNAEGRQNMLRWAAASFNNLGVANDLGDAAQPTVLELGAYVAGLDRSMVAPDGWAAKLFDAADRGDISREEANGMVVDYVVPALDTTILATGHMLWRLAETPGAYAAVRRDPGLIPSVVNESVRMASPIRGFTRYAQADFQIGDSVIPEGARVLVLFASANHDERRYASPETFQVDRNPRDHVGWGHGPHTCVGMHLARLEMEVLLGALVQGVAQLEVGAPTPIRNNVLQGFETLPTRFHS